MYKHTPDLIKVLEIICSQAILNEEFDPELFSIKKQDLEHQEISFHTMKACLMTLQDKGYVWDISFARLDLPYEEEELNGKKFRAQIIQDGVWTADTGEKIVHTKGGYFLENVYASGLIMDNVWGLLSKLKEGIPFDEIKSEYLSFNETESILKIGKHLIPISKRVDRSHPHYLLAHIFNTGREEEYSFESLADRHDVFDKPEQCHNACKDLKKIISKKTKRADDEIIDFLEFSSKVVRINRKYLKD